MRFHEVDDVTIDLLWVMFSPEAFLKFTADLGLSVEEYRALMREAFVRITAPRRSAKVS